MNKLASKLYSKIANIAYLNYRIIFIFDCLLSLVASVLTFLFVNRYLFPIECKLLILGMGYSLLISACCFYVLRTHRNIIRHSSLKSIWKLVTASFLKILFMFLFLWAFSFDYSSYTLLISVFLDFFLTVSFLVCARVGLILIYDLVLSKFNTKKMRVLIYGICDQSLSLKIALRTSKHYQAVGFLLLSEKLNSYQIADLPIFMAKKEKNFKSLITKNNIEGVLFVDDLQAKKESERLIPYCQRAAIQSLIAPMIDLEKGGLKKTIVRKVRIEDVLGRDEIKINMNDILANFRNKVVLVTGAAGSIGSELCRQLAKLGVRQLILFDNAETPMHTIRLELEQKYKELAFFPFIGDVTHENRLEKAFEKYHPQVVFHAAAYKHVPLMEENPCEAVRVNVCGTRNVADNCVKYNVEKMIMISTDKAVNPTNVMGASKRMAEIYVQSLGLAIKKGKLKSETKFVTTRFGNVLGSNGSVIPYFRKQISEGGPVTVTHEDITRYFMTIPEACRLVMQAATMSNGDNIFVFDMGDPVKIVDLATRMIRLAGYVPNEDIEIKFTGLRPGEKLYEELLSNEENTIPTSHQKIRVAKVREYIYDEVVAEYDAIKLCAKKLETDESVKLLKKMIPEYKSNNSIFEKFD